MNSFADFFWAMIMFYFVFMIIWIFIRIFADIFHRHDLTGAWKVIWILVLFWHPVLRRADLHDHAAGHGAGPRGEGRARAAAGSHRRPAGRPQRSSLSRRAADTSAADEITKLVALKDSGAITQAEFDAAKAKASSPERAAALARPGRASADQREAQESPVTAPFKGTISTDIRDSVPDWSPFAPPKAPDGAPSVVYIVLDDVGFSAMSSYGGPIDTPNIDRIAAEGVRYTQWHTTALCSPTRSCLLTGRNHTRNSMACITEAAGGYPNASGTIPPENGMLPEILGELGWNTYMVGKWHLCPTVEMNLASTRRNWPSGRGFERWYGFLGAETNQWFPDLVYDNHPVDPPRTPEQGYHLTEDLTDKALEFIKDAKAHRARQAVLPVLRAGRRPCAAPRREGMERPVQGPLRPGLRGDARGDPRPPEDDGAGPARSTQLPPINPLGHLPDPQGSRRPAVPAARLHQALGQRSRPTSSACSRAWRRSTPASWRTPTTRSAGCSTSSKPAGQRENTLVILVSDNGA